MRKLFGTDGIRGRVGEFPLDRKSTFRLGRAVGFKLRQTEARPLLVIGRDTRESGGWLEEQLAAGLKSMGCMVHRAGVLPTPAIACLVRQHGYQGGAVISASHNSFEDNGIKIFSASGFKLPDETEAEIERLMELDDFPQPPPVAQKEGEPSVEELRRWYLDYLRGELNHTVSFRGLRIAIDCANGAASCLAEELYSSLGAEVLALHDRPDGRNINRDCGSLHPESLMRHVAAENADLGIAFDGDADRAIFVDHHGRLVDGDHVLFLCGRHFKQLGQLQDNLIVTTVMANIGLELALQRENIALERTQVGDKYVLERMLERNCVLGGEQSGHIIFLRRATTGDGMLTGLKVMEVMAATGLALDELARPVVKYPQVLLNLAVTSKPDLADLPEVMEKIRQVEGELQGQGRVLVRYSGTENLARVMIEGPSQELIERQARVIVMVLARCIGNGNP